MELCDRLHVSLSVFVTMGSVCSVILWFSLNCFLTGILEGISIRVSEGVKREFFADCIGMWKLVNCAMYLFFSLMYAVAMDGLDKCIVFFRLSFMLVKHTYDWTNYMKMERNILFCYWRCVMELIWYTWDKMNLT